MKMKLRTRYIIFILCLFFGGFFLVPTVKWYFLYNQEKRNEAGLTGDKLKFEVGKKVKDSTENLKQNKASKDVYKVIYNKFLNEIKMVNRIIERSNIDIERYNKENPNDKMEIKKLYEIKKNYTYEEMQNILLEIKEKQKSVDTFFQSALEDYYTAYFQKQNKVKNSIIKLGLDLQGGAYAVVTARFDNPAFKLKHPSSLSPKEKGEMIDNAVFKIENRINKFGVAETSIQKLKDQDKIVITLPGVKEATELRQIIETVGVLEFKLVSKKGSDALYRIKNSADILGNKIFDSKGELLLEYKVQLEKETESSDIEVLPVSNKDKWGKENENRQLLVVEKMPLLGGNVDIKNAGVQQDRLGEYVVSFELGPEDAKEWAKVTEIAAKNQDEIAIILDNVILQHPVVKEKITGGRSQITLGNTPVEELQNLALILRSGSLDVPLEISEENTVGASLGKDTIDSAKLAMLFGCLFVIVFMFIWYSAGGLIADVIVIFNIFLLLAGLALFKGTLTLPGFAGIILTVGMAVDANVIIYERIKEEFRSGKTFKTAVFLGFDKAFWTIMDANITTFAAGIGLSLFGTGPVKGFAVTLCLGIITTLFTALFGTRLFFDTLVRIFDFKTLRVLSFRGK